MGHINNVKSAYSTKEHITALNRFDLSLSLSHFPLVLSSKATLSTCPLWLYIIGLFSFLFSLSPFLVHYESFGLILCWQYASSNTYQCN